MEKLKRFHEYATERAIKTFAQSALAVISVGGVGIIDVDWANVMSVSLLAMVMSLLTSVLQYDRPKVSE
jgi:tRNA A37 threonylcarbamoyladenosine dehydratase